MKKRQNGTDGQDRQHQHGEVFFFLACTGHAGSTSYFSEELCGFFSSHQYFTLNTLNTQQTHTKRSIDGGYVWGCVAGGILALMVVGQNKKAGREAKSSFRMAMGEGYFFWVGEWGFLCEAFNSLSVYEDSLVSSRGDFRSRIPEVTHSNLCALFVMCQCECECECE